MSVRKMDRKSGQIYEEQAMAPASSFYKGVSWVHESPILSNGSHARIVTGSPTLKDSAMRKLLSDQRNLTAQLFTDIPWRIASPLWDYLGRHKSRTFYMWKVFAMAYPREFHAVAPYRAVKIKEPQMPLRDYLGLIKCESLSWGTVFSLDTTTARVPELVEIADVNNLVALEIATPRDTLSITENPNMPVVSLNDRIVRAWSELVESSGAFAHLRVLRLYNQHDVSPVILRYLDALPSLCLIIAHDCSRFIVSPESLQEDGWEMFSSRFGAGGGQEDGLEFLPLYACYKTTLAPEIDGHQTRQDIVNQDRPILDFRIGEESCTWPSKPHCAKLRSTIYLRRRNASEFRPSTPAPKRQKLVAESVDKTSQPRRSGPKKPVMKKHKSRDLGDMLGDFL